MEKEQIILQTNQLFEQRRYDDIDRILSEETLHKHNNWELFLLRGRLEKALGNHDKAIGYVDVAIGLEQNHPGIYQRRGHYKASKGDRKAAIQDYSKAIELKNDEAIFYFDRAVVYEELGETESAIADYNKAVKLKPDYGEAYANRGTMFLIAGDKAWALSDLNKGVELNQSPRSYLMRAIAFLKWNELENAAADLDKAIALNPNLPIILCHRSEVAALLNDFSKALELVNRSVRIDSTYLEAYLVRGNIYAGQNEFDKALSDYDSALRLNNNFLPAYVYRGRAWLHLGRYWKAIDDFTSALNLVPDDFEALELRGLAQFYAREYAKATKDFEKILELNGSLSNDSNTALEISRLNISTLRDLTSPINSLSKRKGKKSAEGKDEPRPPIPEPMKREVRQKCKSRCVICGSAIYDYEHIEQWSTLREHTADNLTLLCPNHHRQKTNGILSKEVIKERTSSQMIQNNAGPDLNFKKCKLVLGTNIIQTVPGVLFKVFDRDFFQLGYDPEFKQVVINAAFFNNAGEVVFKIVDNVYSTSDNMWDVQIEGKTITIREGHGNILLKIILDGVKNEISVLGKIYFDSDRFIEIKQDGIYCNGNLKANNCTIVSCSFGVVIDNNANIPPGAGIRLLSRGSVSHMSVNNGVIGIALPIEGLNQEYEFRP